jgi:hypothetical protein
LAAASFWAPQLFFWPNKILFSALMLKTEEEEGESKKADDLSPARDN